MTLSKLAKRRLMNLLTIQTSRKQSIFENIPGSSIKCQSPARIERINPPADQLEKLKKELASNKLSPSAKLNKINRLTGFCSVCRDIPTYFMIYDCGNVQKIERYCSSCLEQEKTKKYNLVMNTD